MTKIICCWCDKETEVFGQSGDDGYTQENCRSCGRLIPSSKITRENGKHIHRDWKQGEKI